jgi:hypothetical protein
MAGDTVDLGEVNVWDVLYGFKEIDEMGYRLALCGYDLALIQFFGLEYALDGLPNQRNMTLGHHSLLFPKLPYLRHIGIILMYQHQPILTPVPIHQIIHQLKLSHRPLEQHHDLHSLRAGFINGKPPHLLRLVLEHFDGWSLVCCGLLRLGFGLAAVLVDLFQVAGGVDYFKELLNCVQLLLFELLVKDIQL